MTRALFFSLFLVPACATTAPPSWEQTHPAAWEYQCVATSTHETRCCSFHLDDAPVCVTSER